MITSNHHFPRFNQTLLFSNSDTGLQFWSSSWTNQIIKRSHDYFHEHLKFSRISTKEGNMPTKWHWLSGCF
jgi:hypothetical protein